MDALNNPHAHVVRIWHIHCFQEGVLISIVCSFPIAFCLFDGVFLLFCYFIFFSLIFRRYSLFVASFRFNIMLMYTSHFPSKAFGRYVLFLAISK